MPLKARLAKFILLIAALAGVFGFAGWRLASARPLEAVTPFLYPPFYGRSSEESIFDHSNPNYTMTDNKIVTYRGETLNKVCPPHAVGTPPPGGVCDYGAGGYWSYALGAYIWYNGHDGIDYGISYRPVLAAADTNQVVYAGWYNPQDHRSNLGIYVRLRHPNGYNTWYGHLSALAVQSCSTAGCASLAHGDVIGISGTTGNSSGPHLHFRLTNPQVKQVDPYGWAGAGQDPWSYDQGQSLWAQLPNISGSSNNVYPSGASVDAPPALPSGFVVDDLDSRFDQIPANCWTVYNTSVYNSQNGRLLAVRPITSGSDTCKARWKFPLGAGGVYAVYVRIPNGHATSEGALYNILHDGRTDTVVVNQAVFPNVSISDGWVYIGKYYFNGADVEYILLGNRTQDVPADASGLELAADAVRFVPLVQGTLVPTDTPTPSSTPTITLTPTNSKTPTVTRTPTPSFTPTITRTPTATKTPTFTRTSTRTVTPSKTRTPTNTPFIRPTDTRWPTRTPSLSPTPRPSDTRQPTRTLTPSKTLVASRTPTPSRTPTVTKTPAPTRTPTVTKTPAPTRTPGYYLFRLYFASRARLLLNLPPYEVSGVRYVRSSSAGTGLLNEYFKGPGSTELYVYGYVAIYDGFIGYKRLEVSGDGVARLYLTGACKRERDDFTIANLLTLNLRQVPGIAYVKIYDENENTLSPEGLSDSIPACLDPNLDVTLTPTPSLTPTSALATDTPSGPPTATLTLTRTSTPSETPGPPPTSTRWPSRTPRPTDTRWPTATTRP